MVFVREGPRCCRFSSRSPSLAHPAGDPIQPNVCVLRYVLWALLSSTSLACECRLTLVGLASDLSVGKESFRWALGALVKRVCVCVLVATGKPFMHSACTQQQACVPGMKNPSG